MTNTHFVVLALTVAFAACGSEPADPMETFDCAAEDQDDDYFAGIEKVGDNGYRFQIVDALPAPPDRGENDWTLELFDDSGSPVLEADIKVVPWMTIHDHGSPIVPSVSEGADGRYSISRIDLIMPGPWEITITAEKDGKDVDEVVFNFCARG